MVRRRKPAPTERPRAQRLSELHKAARASRRIHAHDGARHFRAAKIVEALRAAIRRTPLDQADTDVVRMTRCSKESNPFDRNLENARCVVETRREE